MKTWLAFLDSLNTGGGEVLIVALLFIGVLRFLHLRQQSSGFTGKGFQDFLDSLSTKGGNILVTFVAVTLLTGLFLHVIHHNADAANVETVKSILTGFAGALLAMLSGNSSRQQMQDRVETAIASKVAVSKAETVNVAGRPIETPADLPRPSDSGEAK